jgi:hypothetical protein
MIDKNTYEKFSMRYSRKLVTEESPKLSWGELQKKQKLDEKARQFSMVLDQWNIHGPEWRQRWIVEAEKFRDTVPAAKLVLDLGVGQK